MNSVYMMVRHGVCPYFYVCCHNMTLLFRSAGIVRDEMHAVITPTTRGLRAALDEEGTVRNNILNFVCNDSLPFNTLSEHQMFLINNIFPPVYNVTSIRYARPIEYRPKSCRVLLSRIYYDHVSSKRTPVFYKAITVCIVDHLQNLKTF